MPTAEQRFFAKVQQSGDCWVWAGGRIPQGYGLFNDGSRSPSGRPRKVYTHRWAWEFFNGPIPDGLQCDHLCHNRSCVNPWHIQLVTRQLNSENRKGARRGNRSGVRGVTWNKSHQRWQARVTCHGKLHHGGNFTSLADAEVAAIALRNRLFTNNLIDRGENIGGELIAS